MSLDTQSSFSQSLRRGAQHIERFLGTSIVSGALVGVATLQGQRALPDALLQLANSGAVWVVVAFVLGWCAPSWRLAVAAGILALFAELAGYYAAAYTLIDAPTTLSLVLMWAATALVGGLLMGIAGFFARHAAGNRQQASQAALGAIFVGEGLYLLAIGQASSTVALWFAIACMITGAWLWKNAAQARIVLWTLAEGLIMFGCYGLLFVVDMLRAGIW